MRCLAHDGRGQRDRAASPVAARCVLLPASRRMLHTLESSEKPHGDSHC